MKEKLSPLARVFAVLSGVCFLVMWGIEISDVISNIKYMVQAMQYDSSAATVVDYVECILYCLVLTLLFLAAAAVLFIGRKTVVPAILAGATALTEGFHYLFGVFISPYLLYKQSLTLKGLFSFANILAFLHIVMLLAALVVIALVCINAVKKKAKAVCITSVIAVVLTYCAELLCTLQLQALQYTWRYGDFKLEYVWNFARERLNNPKALLADWRLGWQISLFAALLFAAVWLCAKPKPTPTVEIPAEEGSES